MISFYDTVHYVNPSLVIVLRPSETQDLEVNDNLIGHLMPYLCNTDYFTAIFIFCNSAFEQSNLDLQRHINVFIIFYM